eukprot:15433632-Alexandrium_andersonii.AAC.1
MCIRDRLPADRLHAGCDHGDAGQGDDPLVDVGRSRQEEPRDWIGSAGRPEEEGLSARPVAALH